MITPEQEEFLTHLSNNLGVVSLTLQKTGITKEEYDEWCDNIFFLERLKDVDEYSLDYVENKLLKEIDKGNIQAITFYLKTKGKTRGYL